MSKRVEEGDNTPTNPTTGTNDALVSTLTTMMETLARLEERMQRDDKRRAPPAQVQLNPKRLPRRIPRREEPRQLPTYNDEIEEDEEDAYGGAPGVDNDLTSIKIRIPTFEGKNNAEEFIEWERKVEQIFECHKYFEEK